jgi:hypothetical protein
MPLIPGKGKETLSRNISEFHKGETYKRTLKKYGKKKADAQAIAVAESQARRSKK